MNLYTVVDPGVFANELRRAINQVVLRCAQTCVAAAKLDAFAARLNTQLIPQINRLKNRLDIREAIGAPVQHIKVQVYFSIGSVRHRFHNYELSNFPVNAENSDFFTTKTTT